MRIGIDARNLVHGLSGIGRYVLETSRALGELGHSVILYLPEQPMVPIPKLMGCELRVSNFRGPWRRVVWSMTALPRTANKDQLDVFWGPAHRLPPRLDQRVPKILTILDLVWRKHPNTMRLQTWLGERFFMLPALKRADSIVAISGATALDVADFFPPANPKMHTIYPGVTRVVGNNENDPVAIRKICSVPYALFVGTLEPRKNLKRILSAFALVPPDVLKDFRLIIAGGQGWRMNDLSKIIIDNDLTENVTLAGRVSDEELACLYTSASFLLMPSLYEGFGFPIVEAQAFGVPVITSNVSSMPEVAAGGSILVDPYKVSEIADAITKLRRDPVLLDKLKGEARENSQRFSWRRSAGELVVIFENLIALKKLRLV